MNQIQDKIVSIGIAVILIVIFTLYKTQVFKKLPCENNLLTNASRDFIHVDFYHIIINLIAFYYISDLEVKNGSGMYAGLIAIIVVLSSIMTYFADKIFKLKCSIGFSGVILGLLAFGVLDKQEKLDWKALLYLILISVTPTSPNISISGHLIGIIAGVVAFFIIKGAKKWFN